MTYELTKGDRFNLSKEVPNFHQLAIALGWEVNQTDKNYDIDASVFMLAANGRIPEEKYFVFYNNLASLDGAVRHSGDNINGKIDGDDETIYVDLAKINSSIQEIVFVVTIHEGQEKNQNFSQVKNAFIRLYNRETKSELVRYNLKEVFSRETALEFGRLYKKDGEWRFQAVGQGYNAGLQSFVDKYHAESQVNITPTANNEGSGNLTENENLSDDEIIRRFVARVEEQERIDALNKAQHNSTNSVETSAVNPENLEVENTDNLVEESQEPVITTEDFLKRYQAGERDFTGSNLAGIDLSQKTLESNLMLSEANLTKANLAGAKLIKVNLIGANLQGADLSETNLQQADLIEANLSNANLTKASFYHAILIKANLSQAKLIEANLSSANLTGANLVKTNLIATNLSSANLIGANMTQAKLAKANLSYTNLSGVNLSGVNLSGANLSGANLSGVNLKGINLVGSNLQSANLSGQNLSGVSLCGVNLNSANLSEADLTSTDFCGANLSHANLQAANLKGAKLAEANLQNAKLTGAIMPDGTKHE
jgi:uncharacterized protein YjbI with pentapeptide repeats/stress response protein SCP2